MIWLGATECLGNRGGEELLLGLAEMYYRCQHPASRYMWCDVNLQGAVVVVDGKTYM
jgi:hypothetical protein